MTQTRQLHYYKCIQNWIGNENLTSKVLIVAGGDSDYQVFKDLGFKNVTISNLDIRLNGDEFYPFEWSFQDAENLSYDNNSFDYVVVHAALHHCYSPHRALTEMYRVSRKGLIFFESRDSWVMRLVTKLGYNQPYEILAVTANNFKYGGVANTDIPNYVFRWTEREVEKTIRSYAPYGNPVFKYSYDFARPLGPSRFKGQSWKTLLSLCLTPIFIFFKYFFPKQQNLFAVFVIKPNLEMDLFDWLKFTDGEIVFNKDWIKGKLK